MKNIIYPPFGHFVHPSILQGLLFSSNQMFHHPPIAGLPMEAFQSSIIPNPISTGLQIQEISQPTDARDEDNQRKKLGSWQTEELENCFRSCNYPSSKKRGLLAEKLKVNEKKLMNWFQNRRAKHRRQENTRKRPGRPPLSRPPATCSGSPIPAMDAAKKPKNKSSRKVTRRQILPCGNQSNVKNNRLPQNALRRTLEDLKKNSETAEVEGEIVKNEVHRSTNRNSTPEFGISNRPSIVPVKSPYCDTSLTYQSDDEDFIDVCGFPPFHSTPQNHQINHKSSSFVDSGFGSGFSSSLESGYPSTSLARSSSNEDEKIKNKKINNQKFEDDQQLEKQTGPRKKLRFSIESILGISQ